jgi:undecaprenyl-diphosphatase
VSSAQILLLGALAGLTIFIGLPMGKLHNVGQGFKAFLSAMATGILLFLFWDVLVEAIEPVEEALNASDWGRFSWLAALAFVILAVEVNERDAIGFDDPVIAFVQGLGVPTDVWLTLTAAGAGVLLPIGIAVVVSLLLLRRPRTAVVYAGAMIGAALWTQVVKVYIARLRPPAGALVPAPGFSFPSGHTLNSTVTYGLIALLVWRSDLPAWVRRLTAISLTILIILIGLSRIALGVHYPSDVVGGWLAGLAIVSVVALLTPPSSQPRPVPDGDRPIEG